MADLSFLNFHTHRIEPNEGTETIYNAHFSEATPAGQRISLGIHPWYIQEAAIDSQLALIEQALQQKQLTAVGECGLDRLTEAPLSLQQAVFERQLLLAHQYQMPVIIHCVRAFPELIALVKRLKLKIPLIVHGFNANEQIAQQLLQHDFYFSLGHALLKEGSNASKCLKMIPLDRLFLETDDQQLSIDRIFVEASRQLNGSVNELQNQIWQNFQRITAC
ncbi:hydrolase TatD [Siphonobacter sp. BAB-5385]|uniref:TatD family hydrolase n=1 Tax=Siphonobacter sp. BAB-5385 TaxID=1864822 RepID=UPI000B9E2128|nr:TatD family hydrolase [Siphonobacter sp. BAB-5385]OZI08930.1 hydrolase TatD [Siphonobacter sp. BAB-5385]